MDEVLRDRLWAAYENAVSAGSRMKQTGVHLNYRSNHVLVVWENPDTQRGIQQKSIPPGMWKEIQKYFESKEHEPTEFPRKKVRDTIISVVSENPSYDFNLVLEKTLLVTGLDVDNREIRRYIGGCIRDAEQLGLIKQLERFRKNKNIGDKHSGGDGA